MAIATLHILLDVLSVAAPVKEPYSRLVSSSATRPIATLPPTLLGPTISNSVAYLAIALLAALQSVLLTAYVRGESSCFWACSRIRATEILEKDRDNFQLTRYIHLDSLRNRDHAFSSWDGATLASLARLFLHRNHLAATVSGHPTAPPAESRGSLQQCGTPVWSQTWDTELQLTCGTSPGATASDAGKFDARRGCPVASGTH